MLFLFRTVKEETTIGDTPVHAGERVILGIASGNRDEQAYECPAEFRLDRGITKGDAPDHLTFGVGPHICLGIHVARMEGRVVLETMLDRFAPGQVTLADDYELQLRADVPRVRPRDPGRDDHPLIGGTRGAADHAEPYVAPQIERREHARHAAHRDPSLQPV